MDLALSGLSTVPDSFLFPPFPLPFSLCPPPPLLLLSSSPPVLIFFHHLPILPLPLSFCIHRSCLASRNFASFSLLSSIFLLHPTSRPHYVKTTRALSHSNERLSVRDDFRLNHSNLPPNTTRTLTRRLSQRSLCRALFSKIGYEHTPVRCWGCYILTFVCRDRGESKRKNFFFFLQPFLNVTQRLREA